MDVICLHVEGLFDTNFIMDRRGNDENSDPERSSRIKRLKEEEKRLARMVRREREVVEALRAQKAALEKVILDKFSKK